MSGNNTMTRGLRNNNPMNIRRDPSIWCRGLADEQKDELLYTYEAPEWSYGYALVKLRVYKNWSKLHTIRQWITRWAQHIKEATYDYIKFVCQEVGMPPDAEPRIDNKEEMCAILAAMSHFENGVPAVMEDVYKAWEHN